MGTLRYLAERLIGRAEADGKLTGLEGEGAPLPPQEGGAFVDPVEATGFRIMAREGALPPEVVLKKQAIALRQRLATETAPEARKRVMAELADIEMRLAMRMEARRR
ncbi:MAG: DUF1992 domain-containing protein [Pseudomonadota bacterium]